MDADNFCGIRHAQVVNQIENNLKRIEKLEERADEVTKLSTLMEIQVDMNKNQSITLSKINDNLTILNSTTTNLDRRLGKLESDFKEDYNKNNIDMRDLSKKIFTGIVLGVVGTLLAIYGFSF